MKKNWCIQGFDLLRIICVVAVIGIHCFYTNQRLADFKKNFSFAVPCFVMMSLYLSAGIRKNKSRWDFIRKRLFRLFPAFLAWTFIYVFIRYFSGGIAVLSMKNSIQYLFLGSATLHFYFIPMIFYYSLMFMLLPESPCRIFLCLVGLCIAIWGRHRGIPPILIGLPEANAFPHYFINNMPFFFLGILLFDLIEHPHLSQWIHPYSGIISLICAIITIILWFGPYFHKLVPIQTIALYALLFLTFRFFTFSTPRWIISIATVSFGIYLSHHLFTEGLLRIEAYAGFASDTISITLMRFLFSIMISTGFCIWLEKKRQMRWLVI